MFLINEDLPNKRLEGTEFSVKFGLYETNYEKVTILMLKLHRGHPVRVSASRTAPVVQTGTAF